MRVDLQGGCWREVVGQSESRSPGGCWGGGESEKKVVGQSESRSPGEELLAEEG